MLMKLAMEKMLIEVEVSFWMFMLRWVMWYAIVRVWFARAGQDVSGCSTNAFRECSSVESCCGNERVTDRSYGDPAGK